MPTESKLQGHKTQRVPGRTKSITKTVNEPTGPLITPTRSALSLTRPFKIHCFEWNQLPSVPRQQIRTATVHGERRDGICSTGISADGPVLIKHLGAVSSTILHVSYWLHLQYNTYYVMQYTPRHIMYAIQPHMEDICQALHHARLSC